MPNYSQLLSSRQYLALDLLEGLCARAREVTQSAFERGESLSNEELFNLIMIDMACQAEELRDLQGLFAEAGVATCKGCSAKSNLSGATTKTAEEGTGIFRRHGCVA